MSERVINILAFSVLTLLWLAFGAALIANPALLDAAWQAFRSWHLIIQLLVGLLALPLVAGLWIWETSWPVLLRLALVAGLAWVTMYTFFPRKKASPSLTVGESA